MKTFAHSAATMALALLFGVAAGAALPDPWDAPSAGVVALLIIGLGWVDVNRKGPGVLLVNRLFGGRV